jgi:hypothetical protein
MKESVDELYDQNKVEFILKMKNITNSLELQRSRIYDASNLNILHDVGYYMTLLRRAYREIQQSMKFDSRVAYLNGLNKELFKKIKMRDDFEHGVEKDDQVDRETLIQLGIVSKESSGTIRIRTSVFTTRGHVLIISGKIIWNMSLDHQSFLKIFQEFIDFYPFKDGLIRVELKYKQLLSDNKNLKVTIDRLNEDVEKYKQEIATLKQMESLIL